MSNLKIEKYNKNINYYQIKTKKLDIKRLNYEIVNFNNKKTDFFIIDEYDGIKESFNLEENLLLYWYDYKEEFEEWFIVKPKKVSFLKEYLSNEIGILTLMNNSNIILGKRYYDDYETIKKTNIMVNKKDFKYPLQDIKIGSNILEDYINNINFNIYKIA